MSHHRPQTKSEPPALPARLAMLVLAIAVGAAVTLAMALMELSARIKPDDRIEDGERL